jgi:hypothetical protein
MISRAQRQQWGGPRKDSTGNERPARQGKSFRSEYSAISHRARNELNRPAIASRQAAAAAEPELTGP